MEKELLSKFDALINRRRYSSRSEAIRDLIRSELISQDLQEPSTPVVGTITIVYEHHEHELSHTLTELQHQFHECVICSTHVHLDQHNCLEVIIAQGSSGQVKSIADTLSSAKGVKHGQLVCSTTGRTLK